MADSASTGAGTAGITGKLDEKYRQAKQARRMLEPTWFLALAFFQNRQWLGYAGDRLIEPRGLDDPGRITETENRITGIVRTELAKLTKTRPVWVATPQSGDQEDTNAAGISEQMMRYEWKNLNMRKHDLKALEWARITGSGFLKVTWDPTIGDPVDVLVRPDGGLMTDESGKTMRGDGKVAEAFSQATGAQVKSKRIAPGDLRVEAPSPFGTLVDPLADVFEDAEWLIEESVRSVDYCKRHWDVDLKPDAAASPGLVEAQLMGGMTGSGTSTYKGVKIRQYWCKPCEDYPSGARIVWAQGKVLDQDEKPFDPFPWIMYTGIPVPGRLWGMGIVELLQGSQTELNKTLSQMSENRNRLGNPTGIAAKQAVGDSEKFLENISTPGGWHFFDETGSQHPIPQYLEPPTLPDYVKELPDQIRRAMEDISGQHEVTNAQVPPGVTAAAAITLLLDQDDTRLALAVTDHEEGLGILGTKILEHIQRYYTDSRIIKISGDDGGWQIFDFRNTDLRSNTHIEVQAGSTFPQSQAAKQAMMKDIITMMTQTGNGLHGRQLSQFFRDLGLGATDHLLEEYTVNETQVNRENVLLAQGIALPINDYDDTQSHIDGHTDHQKSSTYAKYPPQVKKVFEDHVNQHRQQQDQEQQEQLQMQLQMTGQIPPTLSGAALQDAQQLSQLHGQQQQAQGQQAQQQLQLQGTQQQQQQQAQQAQLQQLIQAAQGASAGADSEQSRRHADEAHAMKMHQLAQDERRAQEAHEQRMRTTGNGRGAGR